MWPRNHLWLLQKHNLRAIIAKVYIVLLFHRIWPKDEKILRTAFEGTINSQILTIHRIIEGLRIKNLEETQFFVDFSKAFDFIYRGKIAVILQVYNLAKEIVTALMIVYKNMKAIVHSPDNVIDFFDIVTGVFKRDNLSWYIFIICLNYVLPTSIVQMKKWFRFKKSERARSKRYPAETTADADDLALLTNTPALPESLLHSQE